MNNHYAVERVMDIIAYMISEGRQGAPLNAIDTATLQAQGYTDSEIAAALSWIMERQADRDEIEGPAKGTFRILHGIEREVLEPDAWGMLMTYHQLGFLDSDDIEQILERAVVMGSERYVGVAEIKALIAAYVIHQQPLPQAGSRSLLLGSDSVN